MRIRFLQLVPRAFVFTLAFEVLFPIASRAEPAFECVSSLGNYLNPTLFTGQLFEAFEKSLACRGGGDSKIVATCLNDLKRRKLGLKPKGEVELYARLCSGNASAKTAEACVHAVVKNFKNRFTGYGIATACSGGNSGDYTVLCLEKSLDRGLEEPVAADLCAGRNRDLNVGSGIERIEKSLACVESSEGSAKEKSIRRLFGLSALASACASGASYSTAARCLTANNLSYAQLPASQRRDHGGYACFAGTEFSDFKTCENFFLEPKNKIALLDSVAPLVNIAAVACGGQVPSRPSESVPARTNQ